MKRHLLILILCLIPLQLLFSQGKPAKPRLGNVALTVEGGATVSDADFDPKVQLIGGGSLEFLFNPQSKHVFGLKGFASIGYLAGDYNNRQPTRNHPGSYKTDLYILGGGLQYNYVNSDILFPYAFVGASYLWFDPRDEDGHRLPYNYAGLYKRTEGNINGELGIRFFIAENFTINLSGRAHFNINDRLDDSHQGKNDDWFYSGMVGFSYYLFGEKDSDMDGVYDSRDECPGTPSGVTVAINGCPEDNDRDGVADYLDKCPNTPTGVKVDATGCPLDSDKDGVADYEDKCPNTPAGVKVDAAGCPLDSDKDGVADYLDKCPNTEAGAKVDRDGCPLDSDGDGVADYLDKCPDTPAGTKVDADGCPVKEAPKEITLSGLATFETGKAVLQSAAFANLDKLVAMMKEFPASRWRIEGHTDSKGSAKKNMALSLARARSVMNYFVGKGIEESRFEIIGLGSERPVADNATEEGRAHNRRVVIFRIDK